MKNSTPLCPKWVQFLLPIILTLSFSWSLYAQEEPADDQTYSPRFYIPNSDTSLDALPLKSTLASVDIAGVIADVSIKQVYTNEGSRSIEAKYVFPASTRAAVYYLHMKIGNRLLIADVMEKQQAQAVYDSALANGNTATLLEQMTPNVFQMSVANILPGDTIEIELRYTELLVPAEAQYEFVFPTVVGPRYTGGSGEAWTEGPYQHEGEDPLYDFNIRVNINAGMPIAEVNCTSDPEVPIEWNSDEEVAIIPDESTNIKGNADFIVEYRLAGNEIQTGVLAYEGEKENFFLAMMQPPQHPDINDIPPREYVFIMDVSGSMTGFPLSVSKELMIDLLEGLRSTDRFNIIFFAGGSNVFRTNSVAASAENINAAINAVENQHGGGGTELLTALQTALSLEGTADYSRIFLIITDGYVTVEKQAFDLINDNLGEANIFSFGIGSSVNRYLIEGLAHVGRGEPFIAIDQQEARDKAAEFKTYINSPVLTNITSNLNGFDAYAIEPQSIPDVFAERPVLLYGKYSGELTGTLQINGTTGSNNFEKTLMLNEFSASESNKALMYLWARKRIQLLQDYSNLTYSEDAEIIDEIVSLGLEYNLLTQYTSFIVVDSIVRCDTCNAETVNQPLPIPEGVSDNSLPEFAAGLDLNKSISPDGDANLAYLCNLYPNPVIEKFSVDILFDSEIGQHKCLQVHDVNGRLIAEIDISELDKGMHTVYLHVKQDLHLEQGGYYFLSLVVNAKTISSLRFMVQ